MQRDDSAPRVGGWSRRCVYICICNYGRSWNTSGNGSDGWGRGEWKIVTSRRKRSRVDEGKRKRKRVLLRDEVLVRVLTAVDKYRCTVRQSAICRETYAPACGRHLETRDLFWHMRLSRESNILCFNPTTAWHPCTRIYEPERTKRNEISKTKVRRRL